MNNILAESLLKNFNEATSNGDFLVVNGNNINLVRVRKTFERNDIYGDNDSINTTERILAPGMPLSSGVSITFPLSSVTLSVASTSVNDVGVTGTGAREITIFGLDDDFVAISETVTLNGQIPVNTIKTFFRVQETIVFSVGVTAFPASGANDGMILISDSDDTFVSGIPQNRCYDSMGIGEGLSKTMVFTVPRKKILLIQAFELSTTAKGNNRLIVRVNITNEPGDFGITGTENPEEILIDSNIFTNFDNSRRRLPGQDIFVTIEATAQTVSAHAKMSTIISEQIPGTPNIFTM